MQDSRWGLTRAEQRGRIPSLDLLATMLLMQPRVLLAFWAGSCPCPCRLLLLPALGEGRDTLEPSVYETMWGSVIESIFGLNGGFGRASLTNL